MSDQITLYLDPLCRFWHLVQTHGWNSEEVYTAHSWFTTKELRSIFGHAEKLMRAGVSPIAYVNVQTHLCSECSNKVDDDAYALAVAKRKIALCYSCWKFLYPTENGLSECTRSP